MSKLFGLLALGIGGIIVADILTHASGVTAASTGITNISTPWLNALLGQPTTTAKKG
jgi:hypothetical protein